MKRTVIIVALTLMLITACAPLPARPQPHTSNPAITMLMQQAKQSAAAGHPRVAEGLIERALRIAPGNPRLWHALARLRLPRHPNEARYLALRSNSLSPQDRSLQARNWQLIAAALAALGHPHQAAAADSRAQALSGP
ncbi:MAG: tetratricopeptide repeat protein [Acidiferrobacteraceae bacterium]